MSAYHPPLATPRLPPAAPLTPQDPTMTDFVPRWTTGDDISHRLLEALANELAQAAESRRTLVGQLRQELMTAAAPLLPALRTATAAERTPSPPCCKRLRTPPASSPSRAPATPTASNTAGR